MAIAYRGKGLILNTSATDNTPLPMPAGTAEGDRLVAVVGTILPTSTITPPAGWQLVSQYAPTNNMRTAVYTRTATATDKDTTYTWGWSGFARNFGYCLAYSGVDASVATSAQATYAQQSQAAPIATPALGLASGDWLLTFAVGRENPGTDTPKQWTNSDGQDVERFDLFTANASPQIKLSAALWDSGRPLPGGSAQRTLTPAPVMALAHVWSVRLAAPEGDTVPPPAAGDPWTYFGMPLR
ncbi:hypothetical protein AB0F93_00035 [Micromonospora tulbaghiae]|uniref:hypothetical protein n=1 Tax=Micromonospora tulbaghiae TaxID=479978 RepID=UPI00333481F8